MKQRPLPRLWLLSLLGAACLPAGAAITAIPGFEGVRVWEATYQLAHQADFLAGDPRLINRLDGAALNMSGRDFGFFQGEENYDLYFSDADGSLNPQGRFLTIDGNCNVASGCFNITEVALVVDGQTRLADGVVRVVYSGSTQVAGSHLASVDGDFTTFSRLGDTVADFPNARMSMTLSFANVPEIPEPPVAGLMAAGLLWLGAMRRRRKIQASAD
ncbi:MAG: PEP-CTERM sorting domain-containing protein [Rubrivivax sp.]|nr:PEP-CTERM sorting domain-containing protein [Rubrivivax sp.]